MVEGFWIVQYEGTLNNGGGVAVFTKGHVFGGDSGSTYVGTYEEDAKTLKARVRIHNYMPGVVSAIGVQGDYDLDVTGTVEGDVIKASGSPIGHQSAGMALKLTKAGVLPE
jgi:T3SS negative regulator,GrlR